MGVIVEQREYKNRYRAEVVDWLLGNVGDWQKLCLLCEFAVEKIISQSKPLFIENLGTELVLGDGTEWGDFGFDVGDTLNISMRIRVRDEDGNIALNDTVNITRDIQVLQGDRVILDTAWTVQADMLPYDNGRVVLDQVIVWVDKQPQGAEIHYGHLTNSDADGANLSSFIDGSITRMIALYMDTLTGWQPLEFIDLQSGMSLRSGRWQYGGKFGTHKYKYHFEIEFMISSFFEELDNFETMTAPSQVFGVESLTDNFQIIGFPEWNNPNTRIQNDKQHTKRLGNTGWFNENYNGLDNDFTILSITYTDVFSSSTTQRLSYGAETRVKAVISGIPNLANGLSKFGIGFIFLPEREDLHKDLETPFQQNLFVNTAGGISTGIFTPSTTASNTTYSGFTNLAGVSMDVKDVHFYISGGNLVYEATFVPTAGFTNFIGNLDEVDRNYALWISVADRTEETNFADRVSLLLDYNKLDLYIPPIGAYEPMDIRFNRHPQDELGAIRGNCEDYIEDDFLAIVKFTIDITEPIPSGIEFVVESEKLFNPNAGRKYELQKYNIDLTGFTLDGAGVPQWNYDEIRGFKLQAGNNKNFVKVFRDPTQDNGNNKGYIAYYGFKMRWEDWILRTGVPAEYFDSSELNNGFNNDWKHYFDTFQHKLQFTVYIEAVVNGVIGRYENNKEILTLHDYDTNNDIDTTWEFFRQSDNQTLNAGIDPSTGKPLGVILDELVRVEVEFENTAEPMDANIMYGTICIEIDKGAGQFEFRQLSSVWGRESDNPLIPLPTETKLKVEQLALNRIKTSCLIDPNLLQDAIKYKLTARLGYNNCCSYDNTFYNGNYPYVSYQGSHLLGAGDYLDYLDTVIPNNQLEPTPFKVYFRLALVDVNGASTGQGTVFTFDMPILDLEAFRISLNNQINIALGGNYLIYENGVFEGNLDCDILTFGIVIQEGYMDGVSGLTWFPSGGVGVRGVRLHNDSMQDSIEQSTTDINDGNWS